MVDRLAANRPTEAVLFAGSRGMGKTVLLRECQRIARASGWFTSFEEVDPSLPLRQVMALNARDVLLDMSATKRFGDRMKRALGVLKAFTSVGVLGVNISFDAELLPGTADTGVFKRDLLALFEEGRVAASDSSGVVFFLDELHTLSGHEEMDVLDAVLHGVMQQGLPISAVGAGVYGGPGYEDLDDPPAISTYAGRLYRVVRLRPLTDEAASEALLAPAREKAVNYDPDALRLAVDFAGGLPWFIQLVGDAAWEQAACSPIGVTDITGAIEMSRQRLRAEFFPRLLGNLDGATRDVLRTFASRPGAEVSLKKLTKAMTDMSYDDVYEAIRTLVRRDIVARTDGESYALAIPQLCEYLVESGRSWAGPGDA
jgi:hypothetical protein